LIASLYDHHRTLAGCTAAPTVAVSAGDLSSLGQDADRVAAVESLAVPSGGGGISGDIWVLVLERQAVSTRRASMWCAEVAAVGADEPEPARAVGQDFELTRVVGHVVAFAQQRLSHESRVADALSCCWEGQSLPISRVFAAA
jgi:hypothetical protein